MTSVVVVVVAGVSGSGKTTAGALLAGRLRWPFTDGDSLHPAANIAKMAAGDALTDGDRKPWLRAIAEVMDERIRAGQHAVIACSALKRSYRNQLLDGRPAAAMAFLAIGRDEAARRLASRQGHFCHPSLLDSQFADLEPPAPDEGAVVLVPTGGQPDEIVDEIIRRLDLAAERRWPSSSR